MPFSSSERETTACLTPSIALNKVASSMVANSSAVPLPNNISEARTALSYASLE